MSRAKAAKDLKETLKADAYVPATTEGKNNAKISNGILIIVAAIAQYFDDPWRGVFSLIATAILSGLGPSIWRGLTRETQNQLEKYANWSYERKFNTRMKSLQKSRESCGQDDPNIQRIDSYINKLKISRIDRQVNMVDIFISESQTELVNQSQNQMTPDTLINVPR